MRQINDAGLNIIKSSEGCKLVAYLDTGRVPTIRLWAYERRSIGAGHQPKTGR